MPRSHSLRLEPPAPGHASEFLAAVARSRALHRRWVEPPDTRTLYRAWLGCIADGSHIGHLVRDDGGELVGAVNLHGIVRGALQCGHLGYYAFTPHQGQGHIKAALGMLIPLAFTSYRLHRLEACIQPDNGASRALIASLGFRQEGFSPRYLKLGGRWRDHERWALMREEWRTPGRRGGVC